MKQRIVAAVPCYNMGEYAAELVHALLKQDYDHVYVFDDCSTDNSAELLSKITDKRFTFVSGVRNQGAGPTRNRILEFEQKGIAHFMDADVLPAQQNTPELVLAAFDRHPEAGAIGFRVRNPDGSQYRFNFGGLIGDRKTFMAVPIWRAGKKIKNEKAKAAYARLFGRRIRRGWTYTHMEDAEHEHKVSAVVECNMGIRLEDFADAGGFSLKLRFHEIHHLAYNLRRLNRTIWYVPEAIAIKHDHGDVRAHRTTEQVISWLRVERDAKLQRYR